MIRYGMTNPLRCLFPLALLTVVSGQVSAYYPPYGYPQYPESRNVAPSTPYWYPYQQQKKQQPSHVLPQIETTISDTAPYEEQSLVYRLRIISQGNLKTIVPVIPRSSTIVLRQLGEAQIEDRKQGDTHEFVTEYRYLLMPLSSGLIKIPPARVTGRFHSSEENVDGPPFEVSGKAITLHVRPASSAVRPWLPLYSLQISARIRGSEAPAAGNPIEMEIETQAVGATGSQIPSVAAYLKSTDFRIYPGKNRTEGHISDDGKQLQGLRVEQFTLVPRYGGWLHLPDVSINWWNVRYNRPEVATLITDQINVMGPAHRGDNNDDTSPGSILFWLPMGFAVCVLLYSWVNVFLGDGRLPGIGALGKLLKPVLGELYLPLVALVNRLSPRRHFHRLRTWTGRHLPISWKLWFCLRAVAHEDDPSQWAQALQILAAKHLGARPHAHLHHLGETIVKCHPRANAEQVNRLLTELDEAVYGNKPVRSFSRWKREFRNQIKPGLFPTIFHRRNHTTRHTATLPTLNP